MRVNISELKNIVAKMNLAIEKTKLNPKSGWIELESFEDNTMTLKVSNYDYYLEAKIPIECDGSEKIHATVVSDTFVPLVSKLDDDYVEMFERMNALIFATSNSEFTFPIIKEIDEVKSVDVIKFRDVPDTIQMSGEDLSTVATINTKGFLDSLFSNDIQQYIYLDKDGALTYTENLYVNSFKRPGNRDFKILLNVTQAKLLDVFKDFETVDLMIDSTASYEYASKVKFRTDSLSLVLVVQSQALTDTFPAIRLRKLAAVSHSTHVILDKKAVDKALARLMVFDKKFGIEVMLYSKLVFKENEVQLVSITNKNFERIPYISSENAFVHESIIRFSDLMKQLKAINSKTLDISYGTTPALAINSGEGLVQLIPEIVIDDAI